MECECEDELLERDREIEMLSDEAESWRERAERAEAAIERVRAVHGQHPRWPDKCGGCDGYYPCPTLAALDTGKETPMTNDLQQARERVQKFLAETCDTFWGSHGCDLPAGHDPAQEHQIHVCFVRVYDEDGDVVDHDYCQRAQYVTAESSRVSYMQSDEETWSEWHEGFGALFRNDEEKIR